MKLRFTREFVVFQAAYFLHGTKNAALTEEILNGKLHFLRSALSRRDFFILPSSLIFLLIFVSKRFNESKMHLNKCDTNFTKIVSKKPYPTILGKVTKVLKIQW